MTTIEKVKKIAKRAFKITSLWIYISLTLLIYMFAWILKIICCYIISFIEKWEDKIRAFYGVYNRPFCWC